MGDDVQIMKAGIMEIADLFVVNKADREGADKVAADVQVMLKMLGERAWIPPVTLVSSYKNTGVDTVWNVIKAHRKYLTDSEEGKRRRYAQLEMEVERFLSSEISLHAESYWKNFRDNGALEDLANRNTDPYTLVSEILSKFLK